MNADAKLTYKLQEIATSDIDQVSKDYNIPADVIRLARETPKGKISGEHYPYKTKFPRKNYEERKTVLQIELVKLQNWVKQTGSRVVIIFEGRDAAGKGGSIKRFMEHLNPRHARVVALTKPSEKEIGQWYFQRYIQHLPTAGEIVFFDRSWYNRAGVEKVMGFCTDKQYKDFLEQVPAFEKMIIESGITLIKFWFSVSRAEQLKRLISRTYDPLKQWKLSPMDIESLSKWDDYTDAKENMFYHTDKTESPWVVIRSDDKKRARLNAMRYVLNLFEYENKEHEKIYPMDKQIIGAAEQIYEQEELIHRELIHKKRSKAEEKRVKSTVPRKKKSKK